MNNPLVHISLSGGGGGGGAVTSVNGQVGDVDLTAADVGAATTLDVLRYISTTNTAPVTGSTAFALISSQLIPANTFTEGSIITIRQRFRKTGTGAVFLGGIYSNTIVSLTGSLQLGVYSSTSAGLLYLQMKRELFIKSATSTETVFTNQSLATDDITTGAVSSTNINWAIDQYILFVVQLSSAADSIVQSGFIIELL